MNESIPKPKVKPCNRGCGGRIYFEKRQGYWMLLDENTGNKHDCRKSRVEQSARISQINYDNKKYGKNQIN